MLISVRCGIKMNLFNLFFILATSLCFNYASAKEKVVVCYYGTWATYRPGLGKFDVSNIDTNLCTHVVYTFMGINARGTVVSLDPYLDYPDNWGRDNLNKFTELKKKNPKLKTLLAVGGWNEGSAKYSIMAANPSMRKIFITSAINIIQTYKFDGLDVDWEYPNSRDTVHGKADIENFTQLLKELREEFDKNKLLLSAAVAALNTETIYDIPGINQYLDLINVMAYDIGGSWNGVTGHNSPLHVDKSNPSDSPKSVDAILEDWIKKGANPEKLVLGLPLYGQTFILSNPQEHNVGDRSDGPGISGPYTATAGMIGYNELCEKFNKELWNVYDDDVAKSPYAVQGRNWVSFDDAISLTKKIEYALKLNISGAMLWSIETDDFRGTCGEGTYPLLRAVNKALGRSDEGSTTNPPDGSGDEFVCPGVGYHPNPKDCGSYYYCMYSVAGDLVPKIFHCPGNLVWDQKNLACDYPDRVKCDI